MSGCGWVNGLRGDSKAARPAPLGMRLPVKAKAAAAPAAKRADGRRSSGAGAAAGRASGGYRSGRHTVGAAPLATTLALKKVSVPERAASPPLASGAAKTTPTLTAVASMESLATADLPPSPPDLRLAGVPRGGSHTSLRSAETASQLAGTLKTVRSEASLRTLRHEGSQGSDLQSITTKEQFQAMYEQDLALVDGITAQVSRLESTARAMDEAAVRVIEKENDGVSPQRKHKAGKPARKSTGWASAKLAVNNGKKYSDPDFEFGSVRGVLERSHRVEELSSRRAELAAALLDAPAQFDLDSPDVTRRAAAHDTHCAELRVKFAHLFPSERRGGGAVEVAMTSLVEVPVTS